MWRNYNPQHTPPAGGGRVLRPPGLTRPSAAAAPGPSSPGSGRRSSEQPEAPSPAPPAPSPAYLGNLVRTSPIRESALFPSSPGPSSTRRPGHRLTLGRYDPPPAAGALRCPPPLHTLRPLPTHTHSSRDVRAQAHDTVNPSPAAGSSPRLLLAPGRGHAGLFWCRVLDGTNLCFLIAWPVI